MRLPIVYQVTFALIDSMKLILASILFALVIGITSPSRGQGTRVQAIPKPASDWTPGEGEPPLLPNAAFRDAKQALDQKQLGKLPWILEHMKVTGIRAKMKTGMIYTHYTFLFSRLIRFDPIQREEVEVSVAMADGKVSIGQLRPSQ
ncbi:hypothetical protein ACXR0O_09630 [Verrucomicrobiota bacterium sgz303538]